MDANQMVRWRDQLRLKIGVRHDKIDTVRDLVSAQFCVMKGM